jgi:4-amino-4-deoxy-L-arabinose transferase-like glycosyltransferase
LWFKSRGRYPADVDGEIVSPTDDPQGLVRVVSRLRRIGGEEALAWVTTVWALALLLRAHLIFMRPAIYLSIDEGYITATGLRLLDGHMLPYVDAAGHRGPILYWIGMLATLFGAFSWLPVRLFAFLTFALTAALAFLCARRAGHLFAGAIASWAVVLGSLVLMTPWDGMSFNGETVLNVFMMAALLCMAKGLGGEQSRPSPRWIAAAGALATMGALSKQVGALTILPLGLWVVAATFGRELQRRERWLLIGAFVGGAVTPALIVLVRYALAGELSTFFYYAVTYNLSVYMYPFRGASLWHALGDWLVANPLAMVLFGLALGWSGVQVAGNLIRTRSLPKAYDSAGFAITVGLGAAASLVGARSAMRDFPHYLVQVLPWIGLLIGLLFEASVERWRTLGHNWFAAIGALLLLPLAVLTEVLWESHAPTYRAYVGKQSPPAVCQVIKNQSKPDDRIFVWGFWGLVHVACERKPASRYVLSTFPSGFVPWFANASRAVDDLLAVPRSREILIADLEKSRTALIVEAPSTLGNRSIRSYEPLARYLNEHYVWIAKADGADVYKRK